MRQSVHRPQCSGSAALGGCGRPAGVGGSRSLLLVNASASQRTTAVGRAATSHGYDQVVETVEAPVLLEAPGSVVQERFQEHQEASDICKQLEALSLSLDAVLQETETVIEANKWDGYTLPADVQEEFVHTYRHARKEDERAKKEARKLRRVQRDAEAAAAAAASTAAAAAPSTPSDFPSSPSIAMQQPLAGTAPVQLQLDAHTANGGGMPAQQQHDRTASPVQPPLIKPASQLQMQQEQQQPQQQPDRQRRRRSSAAATPAAAAATPAPAVIEAQPETAAPGDKSSTDSSSRQRRSRPPAVDAVPAAEPITANRGGAAGPRPALALDSPVSVAPTSSSSSSSSSALPGFGLALNRSSTSPSAAAPVRPGSRRTLRAAGMSSKSSRSSRAVQLAALAAAPPSSTAKLADNNIYGLDMRAELLSAEQEKELAVMVQDLLLLEAAARDLTLQLGRAPTDQEWMAAAGAVVGPGEDPQAALHTFIQRIKHGRQAKQLMISANYKLVVSISRKYQGYGMALGDLINEGIAGLVKGVERFEPSKGCRFSTYAHWWIRQAVTRSLSEQGRLVRLPSHLQEMMTKMTKVSRSFEAQNGREPSLAELSRELGVDASKIQDAYEAVFTPRSLDQPMGDSDGVTLGDIVEDENMLGPEDATYIESLKHDLEGVLANLPPREAGVVRMRFGLVDGHERTLDEIGAQYNVTRERIRQIEAKAIRQLRARQLQAGSVLADYQAGEFDSKQLATRTSSGTKKQG